MVAVGGQSPLVVWQPAMAPVSVVLHGCQILRERSFILQTQWGEKKKRTLSGVCTGSRLCHAEVTHPFWEAAAGL